MALSGTKTNKYSTTDATSAIAVVESIILEVQSESADALVKVYESQAAKDAGKEPLETQTYSWSSDGTGADFTYSTYFAEEILDDPGVTPLSQVEAALQTHANYSAWSVTA